MDEANIREIARGHDDFLPWFAGFWEGEGSLAISGHTNHLAIAQKNKFPLELIQSKLGGNIYPHNCGSFSAWRWQVSLRKDIIKISRLMLPHLKFKQDMVMEKIKILEEKEKIRSWPKLSKPRPWTNDEDDVLRLNLNQMLDEEIGALLKRTKQSVRDRRVKLGIFRSHKTGITLWWGRKHRMRRYGDTHPN